MKNYVELQHSSNGLEWHPDIFNRDVSVHHVFHLLIFNIYLFICSSRKLNAFFFFFFNIVVPNTGHKSQSEATPAQSSMGQSPPWPGWRCFIPSPARCILSRGPGPPAAPHERRAGGDEGRAGLAPGAPRQGGVNGLRLRLGLRWRSQCGVSQRNTQGF